MGEVRMTEMNNNIKCLSYCFVLPVPLPMSQWHDDVTKWNIFRVTGPLCGEFTGHRWIPLTKARDTELWCFLWSAPWIHGWVNNREAGEMRRHHAHYDVIIMELWVSHKVSFVCEDGPTNDKETDGLWTFVTRYVFSVTCNAQNLKNEYMSH